MAAVTANIMRPTYTPPSLKLSSMALPPYYCCMLPIGIGWLQPEYRPSIYKDKLLLSNA